MIDLHIHSHYSDGSESPKAIIKTAKSIGLTAIALTDHDTFNGLFEASQAAAENNILFIPGIEFTVHYENAEIHILGYGVDDQAPALNKRINSMKESRQERNKKIVEKLNKLGIQITMAELCQIAGEDIVSRAHIAAILVHKGYAKTSREAFMTYLNEGKPGFVPRTRFTPSDCFSLIHQFGGKSSLAHANQYAFTESELMKHVKILKSQGLDAIETIYPTYTKRETLFYTKLCQKYGLHQTGGSDYHGLMRPDIRLGTGKGNIEVPDCFINWLLS